MKAATYERYGPPEVVSVREIPRPSPKHDEVLIRVHASTVTSGDWRARSLEMPLGFGTMGRLFFGIRKPRQPILGTELSGRIEEVGRDVTKFQVGDEVFAFTGAAMGCHAEFKCMSQDGPLTFKPRNLTHAQAAALSFGGSTSLSFFKRGRLQRGERILVNGASGGVGSAAVQLAKHLGANVTGLCSTANVDLVRSLGADHVIDYTREDFTRNGTKYDVIVDTAGTAPFSRSKDSLGRDGRLLVVLGGLTGLVQAPWVSMTSHKKIVAGPVSAVGAADLRYLAELAEAGTFKPVIDRSYSLDRIVEAHRYVDSGRKRGSVVIEMGVR
jgi:NADPH:quinone reductase-like Zn-dependent oxidoreductase